MLDNMMTDEKFSWLIFTTEYHHSQFHTNILYNSICFINQESNEQEMGSQHCLNGSATLYQKSTTPKIAKDKS